MAKNQLFSNSGGDVVDRKIALFCSDGRVKYDLKEQIDKLHEIAQ